ncbi:MAG: VPLPA-CTERM-specific exosortase XrtD [Nitrospiraceae bacterium]|jgi:exosortase D (VPLPA-CTERM-specific)|nr:VPLPA-CTERM-specific exosortase XrtD [Nitrospiraceae bacterium]
MSSKLLLSFSAVLATVSLGYLYFESLVFLFNHWIGSDDYSHGMFVPIISLFLIWQSRHRIAAAGVTGSWWGLAVVIAGLGLYLVGELATLYVLQHFSLWIVLVGLVIGALGLKASRAIIFPLGYLLTSIPLPTFLYAGLSSQLQLWSSALGVGCLQLVGVTAFREGNVIDLGPVQLQVVEACSGIRYLLPLTSLALLCAYLFKDRMWKRVILVLSSIPISILVNGFRIGMIGVLVEWYGQEASEGFAHLFEGWVLFMASLGLLILEMWCLAKIGSNGQPVSLQDRFTWLDHSPVSSSASTVPVPSAISRQPSASNPLRPSTSASTSLSSAYLFSVTLLVPVALASSFLGQRIEVPPDRALFVDFPMHIQGWTGTSLSLEQQYIDALRFDDYVLAEYRHDGSQPVTFYSAYYRSQRKGQSAHSPQSCLPGGGWEISSIKNLDFAPVSGMAHRLHANRAVIEKGNQKQIVLYWFKQRDRILTSEYLVKFYLFWDALLRARTDGALVRIASLVGPGETEETVDQRMRQFVSAMQPELNRYVPD